MEKKELLRSLPTKLVYATEEPLILCEEVVGDYAEVRNTMHCFLMQGLSDQEVTVNCLGKVSETDILDGIKEKLPHYMYPDVYVKVRSMPHNANGKIDRAWLKDNYKTLM